MPKPGFRAITISLESYEKFDSMYNDLKNDNALPDGITSFSGYVTHKMALHAKEKKACEKLASKITNIPEKFLEQKTVIRITN